MIDARRPRGRARAALTTGWRPAAAGAAMAVAAVALAGQLVAFAVWWLGGPGSPSLSPRLGWLYTALFLHIPIHVAAAEGAAGAGSARDAIAAAPLTGTVGAALLMGTIGAVGLVYVAGRRVADGVGGGAVERALHATKVAPIFAFATLAISLAVRVRVPVPPNALLGDVTIRPSPAGAFAWPLALALVASAAGGVLAGERRADARGRAERAARPRPDAAAVVEAVSEGAARMIAVALGSSLGVLVVLAAIAPDATSAYARALSRAGPGAAGLAIGHQLLAAPNIATMILVPAMGGCDGVYGSGVSVDLVCIDRFPAALDVNIVTPESGSAPAISPTPRALALIVLVPAGATMLGGLDVGRRLSTSGAASRLAFGATAGAGFALVVAVCALLAGVRVAGPLFDGAAVGTITYGPRPGATLLLALAWGVPGGALGALAGGARERSRAA